VAVAAVAEWLVRVSYESFGLRDHRAALTRFERVRCVRFASPKVQFSKTLGLLRREHPPLSNEARQKKAKKGKQGPGKKGKKRQTGNASRATGTNWDAKWQVLAGSQKNCVNLRLLVARNVVHARRLVTSKNSVFYRARRAFGSMSEHLPSFGLRPFWWQSFVEKWQFFDRFGHFVDKYPPDLAEFGTFVSGEPVAMCEPILKIGTSAPCAGRALAPDIQSKRLYLGKTKIKQPNTSPPPSQILPSGNVPEFDTRFHHSLVLAPALARVA
jgi:hypothetical protein